MRGFVLHHLELNPSKFDHVRQFFLFFYKSSKKSGPKMKRFSTFRAMKAVNLSMLTQPQILSRPFEAIFVFLEKHALFFLFSVGSAPLALYQ